MSADAQAYRYDSCLPPDWKQRRDEIRRCSLAKGLPWPGAIQHIMDELQRLEPRPGSLALLAAREAQGCVADGDQAAGDVIVAAAVEVLAPWRPEAVQR